MWKKYFDVVAIVPGPVIIQGIGTVDFSREDLPVELCRKLYENDCRYLKITAEGKKVLYGIHTTPDSIPATTKAKLPAPKTKTTGTRQRKKKEK